MALTKAKVQQQIANLLGTFEDLRAAYDGDLLTNLDTATQALEGQLAPGAIAAIQGARASASDSISRARVRQGLIPLLTEYGRLCDLPEAANLDMLVERVIEDLRVAPTLVTSRGFSRGSASAGGSNVGNGTISRLTVDEAGYALENSWPETKTARCVSDQNTGAFKHAEVFEFRGVEGPLDFIGFPSAGSGEGGKVLITGKHAGSGVGGSLLTNSSFDSYNTGASQPIVGWTIDTSANATYGSTSASAYRGNPSSSVDGYLTLTGNVLITQAINRRFTLNPRVPYRARLMVHRGGTGADGNIILRMGSETKTVDLTTLAANAWAEVAMPLDKELYPKGFNEDGLTIEIEWASRTTGSLKIDDCIFAPMDFCDGTWWWLCGGSTPFLRDDVFTIADTGGAAGTGVINYWLWRAGFRTFPVGVANWTGDLG